MPNKPFVFKQFSVEQDRCAMKIGTDGILLGAWANLKDPYSILDIGAGTGIIGLMMAQRSNAGLIDALEIDEDAYEQCVDNFENSNWGDRLFCYHASLDEFAEEMQEEEKYDLIISNPPFHEPPLPVAFPPEEENLISNSRKIARFYDALPFEELAESASKLLSDEGEFAVILPFSDEVNFLKIAKNYNLFPNRITRVRGMENTPLKRSLLQLSFFEGKILESELTIEISRHQYTEEYTDLVKDFYLKM